MAQVRITSVRLPAELALDAELVARIERIPMSRLINEAIAAHIQQRRADPEFQARLRERIEADQKMLDTLEKAVN
jgi:post-segregation antitoxin (ccd killing protein)